MKKSEIVSLVESVVRGGWELGWRKLARAYADRRRGNL